MVKRDSFLVLNGVGSDLLYHIIKFYELKKMFDLSFQP